MEELESWEFVPSSVLRSYTENTPPNAIFRAVCDELGGLYSKHGFKYAKSRPKISGEFGDIKFKMGFWSSRVNTSGNYINLEIIPSFSSIRLGKVIGQKEAYIWGHPDIFHRHHNCKPGTIVIRYAYAPDHERAEDVYENTLLINNNVNLWGINQRKFVQLVNFINKYIISVIDILQDESKLREYLLELDSYTLEKVKGGSSSICRYLTHKYPDLHEDFLKVNGMPR